MKRNQIMRILNQIIDKSDDLEIINNGYCTTFEDRDGNRFILDISPDWEYHKDNYELEKCYD